MPALPGTRCSSRVWSTSCMCLSLLSEAALDGPGRVPLRLLGTRQLADSSLVLHRYAARGEDLRERRPPCTIHMDGVGRA